MGALLSGPQPANEPKHMPSGSGHAPISMQQSQRVPIPQPPSLPHITAGWHIMSWTTGTAEWHPHSPPLCYHVKRGPEVEREREREGWGWVRVEWVQTPQPGDK